VPPGALHHDAANKVLHLDANADKLKGAPEFKTAKWTEHFDSERLAAVYAYYGQERAFQFIRKDDRTDATIGTTTARNADGTFRSDRLTGESQWMIPTSRLGQIQKASKVMGLSVKNRQDETLGTVDNLLVDVRSGRIVAVVVSSGGFLGMGDELSAVPPIALSFNAGRDTLQLDTSKELLSAAPHFPSDQWPDFSQPVYSDSVYRAYKVAPYFTTNTVADADNTARNVRDRGDRTLTPFAQGNSRADTETTAHIRRGILADKNMSVNAKNVKIITNDGRVTLRGPVKNAEEKRMIGEIANRIARSENVDNQLEVTLKSILH
jgi:hyperosmotically inducible periplasmic protein